MKALIILNGDYAGGKLLQSLWHDSDIVICADGGAHHAKAANIPVDIVLGDMDSFEDSFPIGAQIIEYPVEKDLTDGELAIDTAVVKGADSIIIACAGGGRPDHFYGNLLLLKRAMQLSVECRVISGQFEIALVSEVYSSAAIIGKTVSVLPFGGGFTYRKNSGLHYIIDSPVHVKANECFGISNKATSDHVEIHISDGYALVFREL